MLLKKSFAVYMLDEAALVLTAPAPVENSRVFHWTHKPAPGYTTGTGGGLMNEQKEDFPNEESTRDFMLFYVSAIVSSDREEFITTRGREFAGRIWDKANKPTK